MGNIVKSTRKVTVYISPEDLLKHRLVLTNSNSIDIPVMIRYFAQSKLAENDIPFNHFTSVKTGYNGTDYVVTFANLEDQ